MNHDLLTEDSKAIILLCGVFGNDRSTKPLSQDEYRALVQWLHKVKLRPKNLLQNEHWGQASTATGIDLKRLQSLLGRGIQLGFAVEEWHRNGIWVVCRSDGDYPVRYKKHLKDRAPAVLYGVGNRALLSGGGLAVVGSRNVDGDTEAFTRDTARKCARNQMAVVTGAAGKVDQIAMGAVLEAGGVAIGITADNLLKKSVERGARRAIAQGRLLLLSPFPPHAPFSARAAMARNKLIYAMADYGLVVDAGSQKGGTWEGVTEALGTGKGPSVFLRMERNVRPNHKKLITLGAIPWPHGQDEQNLAEQLAALSAKPRQRPEPETGSLFDIEQGK